MRAQSCGRAPDFNSYFCVFDIEDPMEYPMEYRTEYLRVPYRILYGIPYGIPYEIHYRIPCMDPLYGSLIWIPYMDPL